MKSKQWKRRHPKKNNHLILKRSNKDKKRYKARKKNIKRRLVTKMRRL
jgi:hypothetical protein